MCHEPRRRLLTAEVKAELRREESASPAQTVSVAESEHPPSGPDGTFGAAEYAGRGG